jgi:nitroreductase
MPNPFEVFEGRALSHEESIQAAKDYLNLMNQRRSIRHFSNRTVSKVIIENLIKTASTSPSGAHKQPWHFCAISDPEIKKQIRIAAEKEEYENYHGRMSDEWLEDLEPFATDWHKPFLETAPWLIAIFKKPYDIENNEKKQNYYVNESVGIASGLLISAIHQAGLVTLTHTPSPMNFLQEILKRPKNERPFLLMPIGYPANGAKVPSLRRKSLDEMSSFYQ